MIFVINPIYAFSSIILCMFLAPKDFFQNDSSLYKTEGFNDGAEKHIDVQEYVAIICDILRTKKKLCLCRHFHRLEKKFIEKKYIDVRPINVFNTKTNDPFDIQL